MFKNPFSFSGRIRRLEYGLTIIIYTIIVTFTTVIIDAANNPPMAIFALIVTIPMLIFLWAQGAKRLHDIGEGMSGWYQLIPFFGIYMTFAEGKTGANQFGLDPKMTNNNSINSQVSNQSNRANSGGSLQNPINYNGGHNSNQTYSEGQQVNSSSTNPKADSTTTPNKGFSGSNPYSKN